MTPLDREMSQHNKITNSYKTNTQNCENTEAIGLSPNAKVFSPTKKIYNSQGQATNMTNLKGTQTSGLLRNLGNPKASAGVVCDAPFQKRGGVVTKYYKDVKDDKVYESLLQQPTYHKVEITKAEFEKIQQQKNKIIDAGYTPKITKELHTTPTPLPGVNKDIIQSLMIDNINTDKRDIDIEDIVLKQSDCHSKRIIDDVSSSEEDFKLNIPIPADGKYNNDNVDGWIVVCKKTFPKVCKDDGSLYDKLFSAGHRNTVGFSNIDLIPRKDSVVVKYETAKPKREKVNKIKERVDEEVRNLADERLKKGVTASISSKERAGLRKKVLDEMNDDLDAVIEARDYKIVYEIGKCENKSFEKLSLLFREACRNGKRAKVFTQFIDELETDENVFFTNVQQDVNMDFLDISHEWNLPAIISGMKLRTLVIACWHMSNKDRNGLIHALNGNIDYVDSDMTIAKQDNFTGPIQVNTVLFTNNTNTSIKWKDASYNLLIAGVGIPSVDEFTRYMVQVLAPGETPFDLNSFLTLVNSTRKRAYSLEVMSIRVDLVSVILQSSQTKSFRNIIVPPGYSIIGSSIQGGAAVGTIIWQMFLSDANIRPVATAPEGVRVNVHINNGVVRVVGMNIADVKRKLMKRYNVGNIAITTKVGNRIRDDVLLNEQDDYYVKLPILGGSEGGASSTEKLEKMIEVKEKLSSEPGVNSIRTSMLTNTVSKPNEVRDKTIELNGAAEKIYLHLIDVMNGKFDKYITTTATSYVAILDGWATTLKAQNLSMNNNGARAFNNWHEQCFNTLLSYSTEPSAFSAVETFGIIQATYPVSPPITMSAPWATMYTAMTSSDIITISQYVRINTSLANGDAMNRVLAASGSTYAGGRVGSYSSVLAKILLYINNYLTLTGIENASIGNIHPYIENRTPPHLVVEEPYPLSGIGGLTVTARLIDTNTFTAIRAGTFLSALPPIGWQISNWGSDVAIIPVDFSMLNQSRALALWILTWLEYPYRRFETTVGLVDDLNSPYVGFFTSMGSNGANVRIAGVKEKVILVVTNLFQANFNEILASVGLGVDAVNLSFLANGINGAALDITAALASIFSQGDDSFISACNLAQIWWYKFYGNKEDEYAAFIAAACSSYKLPSRPFIDSRGDPEGVLSIPFGGTFSAWNRTGINDMSLPEVDSTAGGQTNPDVFLPYDTFDDIVNQTNCVRFLGAIDYIAAVDCMWGAFKFTSVVENPTNGSIGSAVRMRFIAQAITSYIDAMTSELGLNIFDMMNMSRLHGNNYAIAVNQWHKIYDIYKSMIFKMCPGCCMTYKSDNYGTIDNSWIVRVSGMTTDLLTGSMQRKPLSEQYYMCTYVECDSTYIQKKLETPYNTRRLNPPVTPFVGTEAEMTTLQFDGVPGSNHKTMRQIASTYWITGDIITRNRTVGAVIQTNSLGLQALQPTFPLCYPSCSVGSILTLQVFSVPNSTIIDQLWDVPYNSILPSRSIYLNQQLYLTFNSDGIYFATLTRQNRTEYKMRIIPDTDTFPTEQLGDGVSAENVKNTSFGTGF